MSWLQLGPVIFGPIEDLIAYMRSKGLLARNLTCSRYADHSIARARSTLALSQLHHRCNIAMQEVSRRDVSDQYSWWCRECKGRKSIRTGSFFQRSKVGWLSNKQKIPHNNYKVTLRQWLIMMLLWAREYPVTGAAKDAEISERMAIDIYQWLREVCTNMLLSSPIILGGPGVIVQIDESLFRHKPKVSCL